jgi:L-lysine 6-transaminase
MTATLTQRVPPADVHAVLARYILTDGFDLVFDFEKSRGARVHDAKSGRDFLDFFTFFASSPIGYNHPRMREPEFLEVLHRVAQFKPSLSDVYSVEYAEFVEAFGRHMMPPYLPHAFFIEGGALAVENALKTAFDWKVRRNKARGIPGERGHQVIHFRQAFHGRSGYTLSLTNTVPIKTDYFPKFPWPRIDNPKLHFPVTPGVERDVRAAEERAFEAIRNAFVDHPDDVAAIIIEPIQAEGGDNHFRAEFLQELQRVARENDCFFIVDEVQTGVGITGKMWAHEHFGLQPDALAFGKKTQACGCLVGPRVDEVPDNVFKITSRINSTWGGNLTDMVRFGQFLRILEEERLVDNARLVGGHLLRGLEGVQAELGGLMSNARGRGLMIAFDLPDGPHRKQALNRCRENGLMALPCGERSVRFRPPLNLTRAEADEGLAIVQRSLRSL